MELTERQKQILSATVRTYIMTGEPVGSKMLCEVMPIKVSSATIRSVLSDLCEMGFLTQPHTSAGRVPTAMGYRFYVEELMQENSLSADQKNNIDRLLQPLYGSTESVLEEACESLAALTGCAAMVTTPGERTATLRSVQLILIGKRTVMTVIVTSNGIIKNRVARCDMNVSPSQLENAQNAIDSTMVGKNLDDISAATSQDVICKLGADMLLLAPIVTAVVDAVISAVESELKLKGESNLLINNSFSGAKAARLLSFLQNRSSILGMLKAPKSNITVMLGDETGEDALMSSGMIITNYNLPGRTSGTIGILGPERMDYERIIPGMLYFRDSLQRLLNNTFSDDGDL